MNEPKVYFVAAPGRIKIGFTRSPEKRLIALRRADMEELTVIGIIDGKRDLETKLHGLLAEHRLRGEWFVDCEAVRQVITDAIAGKHAIAEPAPFVATHVEAEGSFVEEDIPLSREFQIIARLADEVHAALDRGDDKYEIRGRVSSLLSATELFIEQKEDQMKPPVKFGGRQTQIARH